MLCGDAWPLPGETPTQTQVYIKTQLGHNPFDPPCYADELMTRKVLPSHARTHTHTHTYTHTHIKRSSGSRSTVATCAFCMTDTEATCACTCTWCECVWCGSFLAAGPVHSGGTHTHTHTHTHKRALLWLAVFLAAGSVHRGARAPENMAL